MTWSAIVSTNVGCVHFNMVGGAQPRGHSTRLSASPRNAWKHLVRTKFYCLQYRGLQPGTLRISCISMAGPVLSLSTLD